MGRASSFTMADLAVQYLLTLLFMGISFWIFMGYFWSLKDLAQQASVIALKLLNPGWLPRVMMVLPAYFSLTLRAILRFWVKHGFAVSFMLVTLVSLSATLGAATQDDPYTVIGASSSTTTKQIRKLCRKKSLEFHPDKHPGHEEEVRPIFERIARSCKTLADPKKKSAYDRFGIVDDDTASQQADPTMSLTWHLGWFGSLVFYSTLCVGFPITLVYNYASGLKSTEDQVSCAVSSAKSLHGDLLALYEYPHFGSATLDCAQLYLALGKWELDDQASILKESHNSVWSSKISSLSNAHAQRHGLWLARAKADDKRVLAANKRLSTDWFATTKDSPQAK